MVKKIDSELRDINSKRIYEGDIIRFCGYEGEVVFDYGCLGVSVKEDINYDVLQKFMDEHKDICCGNLYSGCMCDNFISLWEIYWNFNCIEDYLWMIEKVN